MTDWDTILEWRLLSGSHAFPGPDGGTCINEAAIVAAGLEYRKVSCADVCPPCFSRVLSQYLMSLNDTMSDEARQRLKPFVVRLAGSADRAAIERERAQLIALATVREVLPLALEAAGVGDAAQRCRDAADLSAAAYAARGAADAAYAARDAAYAAAYACNVDCAIPSTALAVDAAAYAAAVDATAWSTAISIVERAFAIGAQGDAIEVELVVERMERAKAAAAA